MENEACQTILALPLGHKCSIVSGTAFLRLVKLGKMTQCFMWLVAICNADLKKQVSAMSS